MITYQDNTKFSYDQWKFFRKDYIGSSEVGPIVYGNQYTSNIEIFYSKIGGGKEFVDNIRTWLGRETEDTTAKCWQYYEGSDESVVKNHNIGRKVKEGINKKLTIFNSAYPGRASTPDIFIQPFGIYKGRGEGFLEIKNTQTMVMKSYENGIPTDNVLQLCDQMMMGDVGYGELFYFIDNRRFEGYNLERKQMKNMEQLIKQHTLPLWQNVLKARPLYNQMCHARLNFNFKLAAELEREIAQLEPPPQNTTGYLNFLNERYKERMSGAGTISGTDTQLLIAQKHKELGKKIDKLEKQQRQLEVELKTILGSNSKLDFGQKGAVTWYLNSKNSRQFKNNLK